MKSASFTLMNGAKAREPEPALGERIAGAILYPRDAHLRPDTSPSSRVTCARVAALSAKASASSVFARKAGACPP